MVSGSSLRLADGLGLRGRMPDAEVLGLERVLLVPQVLHKSYHKQRTDNATEIGEDLCAPRDDTIAERPI